MDIFLDISWTLHHVSTNSASYHNLFVPAKTTQNHLPRYLDRLPQYLSSQKPSYINELGETEGEKLGPLRDCKYSLVRTPELSGPSAQPQESHSVQVQLIYQHKTFTFILYTPHIVLSRASAIHTKYVLDFLSETFSICIFNLKLPSSVLSDSLQGYIETLISSTPSSVENDGLDAERKAAVLHFTINHLRITVQFSGSVAKDLRSVELNVPYDTVDALLQSCDPPSPNGSRTKSAKSRPGDRRSTFMQKLAEHLHLQTGLKLPLTGETASVDSRDTCDSLQDSDIHTGIPSEAPVRVSKLSCAAFAISVDGKLKFAGKSIESAADSGYLVIRANLGVLDDVVAEARRQEQATGID